MKQIAKRVYNNNVVLSENASGEEIILVGKGLAFGLNKGDLINTDKIEKKFELKKEVNHKFQELIQDVSMEEILICDDVINYIKKTSNKEIDDSIYVTLTDHIVNMIDRLRQGIDFDSAALLNIAPLLQMGGK
jgi:beta-glucoside operon transcriptional antiterminator